MNGGIARSKTTAKTRVLDVPAHDPQRVGKQLFGGSAYPRQAVLAAGDDRRCGAVTEQGRRDHGGGIVAVEPDRDRTGLDRDEQPQAARIGRGKARGEREAVDAAGAAEAEDRHAADIVAKPTRGRDAGFEAGGRDSGGRDGDDAVDLIGRQACLFDGGRSGVDEQFLGGFQIDRVAVMPAVGRACTSRAVRRCGAGRFPHCRRRPTAGRTGLLAAEASRRERLRLRLLNDVGGNRRRQRE